MMFLSTFFLTICSLNYALWTLKENTYKNNENYVLQICQHIIGNVIYLCPAIYIIGDKLNIIEGANLNVRDNAYFLFKSEYVCLECVTDFLVIR